MNCLFLEVFSESECWFKPVASQPTEVQQEGHCPRNWLRNKQRQTIFRQQESSSTHSHSSCVSLAFTHFPSPRLVALLLSNQCSCQRSSRRLLADFQCVIQLLNNVRSSTFHSWLIYSRPKYLPCHLPLCPLSLISRYLRKHLLKYHLKRDSPDVIPEGCPRETASCLTHAATVSEQ